MSHTPGPWEINQHYVEAVGGPCRARIAIIDDGAGTNPEANAHLIAAAPEMLAALENLENDNGQAMPPSAWAKVQAAIAKAKGEA